MYVEQVRTKFKSRNYLNNHYFSSFEQIVVSSNSFTCKSENQMRSGKASNPHHTILHFACRIQSQMMHAGHTGYPIPVRYSIDPLPASLKRAIVFKKVGAVPVEATKSHWMETKDPNGSTLIY